MKPVRIPPIGPILFALGLAAILLWPKRAPPEPHVLVQRAAAWFDDVNAGRAAHADLLTALYSAPPERLRILRHRLVAMSLSDEASRAVTTSSVTAEDIGTQAVVKRNTRLYWQRTGEHWRLDVDSSTIDALTVNFVRAVREGDAASAAAFVRAAARTAGRGRELVERYNWLPGSRAALRPFKVLGVRVSAGGRRGVSFVCWRHAVSGREHRVEIRWIKGEGSWWVAADAVDPAGGRGL